MTYTYVKMPLSQSAYDEIKGMLVAAGYSHAINENGDLDMHGIAVCVDDGKMFNVEKERQKTKSKSELFIDWFTTDPAAEIR